MSPDSALNFLPSYHCLYSCKLLRFLLLFTVSSLNRTWVSCICRQILYCWAAREALVFSYESESVSRSVVSYFLRPHGLQTARLHCPPDLQVRILEWVAIPSSWGSFWPREQTPVSCIAGRFFIIWASREAKEQFVSAQFLIRNLSCVRANMINTTLWKAFSYQTVIPRGQGPQPLLPLSSEPCLLGAQPLTGPP